MGNTTSQRETKQDKIADCAKARRLRRLESIVEEESSGEEVVSESQEEENWEDIDPREYLLPFENLVFEGGGAKGSAYWGAAKYLEEIGAMSKITRFGGTSVGSLVALFIAIGLTYEDVKDVMTSPDLFYDGSWYKLLPNLLAHFGVHPLTRFYNWLGEILQERTGSRDITFQEVYQKYGKELCVVITNLNLARIEHCHPKTTPDMPIRLAVRMSVTIPGLFTAMAVRMHGERDVYVDGGMLSNYPVNSFDGWYLSMANEDNLFKRLHGDEKLSKIYEKRFHEETVNFKTLGFLIYSEKEAELMRSEIEEVLGKLKPAKPKKETKIYQRWLKEQQSDIKAKRVHDRLIKAALSFMELLEKHNLDNNNVIDRTELENALADETFSRANAKLLFGDELETDLFNVLDRNGDGLIQYNELMAFLSESGICLHNRFLGYKRSHIGDFLSFIQGLLVTLTFNTSMMHFQPRDIERTVGINTGYIETQDFGLEDEDLDFLIERGYNACKKFLQRFVVTNSIKKKSERSPFPN